MSKKYVKGAPFLCFARPPPTRNLMSVIYNLMMFQVLINFISNNIKDKNMPS